MCAEEPKLVPLKDVRLRPDAQGQLRWKVKFVRIPMEITPRRLEAIRKLDLSSITTEEEK
mgnify:FL=1|jgi:hypothetical protein